MMSSDMSDMSTRTLVYSIQEANTSTVEIVKSTPADVINFKINSRHVGDLEVRILNLFLQIMVT